MWRVQKLNRKEGIKKGRGALSRPKAALWYPL